MEPPGPGSGLDHAPAATSSPPSATTQGLHSRAAMLADVDDCHRAICSQERDLLAAIVELDRAKAWKNDGPRTLPQWITARYGISNWKARRWIEAGYALESHPHLAAALSEGKLCLDKVCELARFITPSTERDLVRWAKTVSLASIRRRADLEASRESKCSSERFLNHWRSLDGRSIHIEALLPTDKGEVIIRALDRLTNKIPDMPAEEGELPLDAVSSLEQKRADALYLLASAKIAADPDQDRATLVLYASLAELAADKGTIELEGGALIDVETARRLTCDCRTQAIVCKDNGDIGVGRTQRLTPRRLRRLVMKRDGHACAFPGCEMATHLTPHHIVHWVRGGETTLLNLVMLCPFHHQLIHEGGWSVILDGKQLPLFFRPSGRLYDPTMPVDEVDLELAELLERERHREPDKDSIEARFGVKNFEREQAASDTTDLLFGIAQSLAGY